MFAKSWSIFTSPIAIIFKVKVIKIRSQPSVANPASVNKLLTISQRERISTQARILQKIDALDASSSETCTATDDVEKRFDAELLGGSKRIIFHLRFTFSSTVNIFSSENTMTWSAMNFLVSRTAVFLAIT